MRIVTPPAPVLQRAGSLLVAANTPASGLDRPDQAGYHAPACTGWGVYDPCGTEARDHGADVTGEEVAATPFAVVADDECTTFGFELADYQGRARARLEAVESAAIAHELWTGELATAAGWEDNPRLQADGDVTDLTPTDAVTPVDGVALLEDALGDLLAGGAAAIHCTRRAATHLVRPAGLRRDGDLLLTALDTRVIADAGYPGTGPTGAAAPIGEAWLFGTARPTVRRSEISLTPTTLAEATDRSTNHVKFTAERLATATFPCGVLAVRITLT